MAGALTQRTSLKQRIDRWCRILRRHIHFVGVSDFVLLGLAAGLAVNAASVNLAWTVGLGVAYFVVLLARFIVWLRSSFASDRLKAEVLWGLFHQFDKSFFGHDGRARITLFRPNPLSHRTIVPWYRYVLGESNAVTAANDSFAKYKAGEGYTGRAWTGGGGNNFQMAFLSKFDSRQTFERAYVDLGIKAVTTAALSPFMEDVGVILSCRFCDTRGKFLGLLSIDLQWHVDSLTPDHSGNLRFKTSDGQDRTLNLQKLATIVLTVDNILRSFSQTRGA